MRNCLYNRNNNIKNNFSCENVQEDFYKKEVLDRNCENKDLMNQMKFDLQATDFAIEDLALYLDTHPDDMRAVCMHNQYAREYRKLSDEYQKVNGPLNIMYPCNSWRWIEEPWPWDRKDNCTNVMQNCREDRIISKDTEIDFELKGGIN